MSPAKTVSDPGSLRYIVIDGSNVAMRLVYHFYHVMLMQAQ